MSHFSRLESKFLNLDILKQSLDDLNVVWDGTSTVVCGNKGEKVQAELVIHQSNAHDIGFEWTDGKGYSLVADLAFWDQPYSPDTFLGYLSSVKHKTQRITQFAIFCSSNSISRLWIARSHFHLF